MSFHPYQEIDDIPLLIMSVTDRCNLRCSYCYKHDEMQQQKDLPLQEMIEIYDKFQPRVTYLYGGEPTLRWDDILAFLDYAYPKMLENGALGIEGYTARFSIITNGATSVDFSRLPETFRQYTSINFSLDGFEDTNDKTRGKGNFQKTHDNIRRCVDLGLIVNMTCTFTDEDYLYRKDYIQKFVDYFETDIGVNALALNTVFSPNTKGNYEKSISAERRMAVKNAMSILSDPKVHHIVLDRIHPCGQIGLYIHSDGQVTPKCCFLKPILGHWTEWTKENLIKLHKYCDQQLFDCTCSRYEHIQRYAQGLLLLEKQAKEGGGGSGQ